MKTLSQLNNLAPVGGGFEQSRTNGTRGVSPDLFREQLTRAQSPAPQTPAPQTNAVQSLKFSNHAIDRMQSRGIHFSPDQLGKIESAVTRAAAKGSKNSLLLTDNAALIVSVKDKTVVTVMDKTSLKDNVFTNIDSTVMI